VAQQAGKRESGMAELMDGPRWGPAAGGKAKQLVVLLHGLGADGHDLIDLAPGWGKALPEAAFVSPDAPFPCDLGPYGRQWMSVQDRAPEAALAGATAAAVHLDAFLDAELARHGLPGGALALMGFSQGAMMTLFAGLRRKVAPAALLAFSGRLVGPVPPLQPSPPAVLLVHGEADEVVPIAGSLAAESALRAAGLAVETSWRPGLGHGIDQVGITMGALALQQGFAERGLG
jgi:phospholipase/carboxylesterase